ncbi:MAG: RNA polymerase subunit sigma-70 [Proteobacteria bacterium]|nr:MAG: RNA polymerase subunit sigma-70 [Pseudomonadota bacterium]PIE40118.1 MAG: RNA polymerase subunit sigma-70 [Gammaproteobacteria bacterium]
MKASRRAKRKKSHYRRMNQKGRLNLVSLMDIFTILVFFLMVNSSDVQVLNQESKVKLPESTADHKPDETLVIVVTEEDILVQGRMIVRVDTIDDEAEVIGALAKELDYLAKRDGIRIDQETGQGGHITIMGQKTLPYSVLKPVMNTCVNSHYTRISLAVNQISEKEA